jgi:hypothetical protein
VLGWQPRPAAQTVLDCALSLIDHGAAWPRHCLATALAETIFDVAFGPGRKT